MSDYMSRPCLAQFTISIMAPSDDMPNDVMDAALRIIDNTMGYRDNLQRLIRDRFVDGIVNLGEAGFTVEVSSPENAPPPPTAVGVLDRWIDSLLESASRSEEAHQRLVACGAIEPGENEAARVARSLATLLRRIRDEISALGG